MNYSFEHDPFPGKPRILFIGNGASSHTHSWIGLLEKAEVNVRLFSMPGDEPPIDWNIPSYISQIIGEDGDTRQYLNHKIKQTFVSRIKNKCKTKLGYHPPTPKEWLEQIINEWKPNVIHTLGLFDGQGGEFFLQLQEKSKLLNTGKWVLQLRGGSDLTLRHNLPEYEPIIQQALEKCDYIISDNYKNIEYCESYGIPRAKFAPFMPVPGTGGIHLQDPLMTNVIPPSQRERIILWPKAYDCKWSLALPVLEAIKNSWSKISPCEIHLLATSRDTYEWFMTLPEEIRNHCHIHSRLPRSEVFTLMQKTRIMLAPSLVDGVPNSLYEAMAYGAFPIVSPLDTILPLVKNETNVLFARNLYPDEISNAIIRALEDDALVDTATSRNLLLVQKMADRQTITNKVISFYEIIAKVN